MLCKKQRLKLEKRSVQVVDFRDNQEAQNLCRQNKAERAAYMILLHDNATDNFSSFLELDTYIRNYTRDFLPA